MRQLIVSTLILLSSVMLGTSSATAAQITPIGVFSWEPGVPDLVDPVFSFVNLSNGLLADLSVEVVTDSGTAVYDFLYPTGLDSDGDGFEELDSIIPDGAFAQIFSADLLALTTFQAFLRTPGGRLFLVDPHAPEPALLRGPDGAAVGLDESILTSAAVAFGMTDPEPPPPDPVPEPATILLVGIGALGALIRSRRLQPRR
jgi:hypothetical protein